MSSTSTAPLPVANDEQRAVIQANLQTVRAAIKANTLPPPALEPLLIAVSTGRSLEEILICHNLGLRDFGEDNAQELFEKAKKLSLPFDSPPAPGIVWHFLNILTPEDIDLLQLFLITRTIHVHALLSEEVATILNNLPFCLPLSPLPSSWLNITIPQFRPGSNIYSLPVRGALPHALLAGEDQGEVVEPGSVEDNETEIDKTARLAEHIVRNCPRLRFAGLTFRSTLPPSSPETPSASMQMFFRELNDSRDRLQAHLEKTFPDKPNAWGTVEEGRLRAKMGRSRNFQVALEQGSDILAIGEAIFGPLPAAKE